MDLQELVSDVAEALVNIDESREPFRGFQPGVEPYGEPQLARRIASKADPALLSKVRAYIAVLLRIG